MKKLPEFTFELPYLLGSPPEISAHFKSKEEDFCVEEALTLSSDDEGEHVWLQIEKTGENTQFVANELSRFAGIRPFDVGFSGLKDKHAVTKQWFSLWLPAKDKEPNWIEFNRDKVKIINIRRQVKKIRRGDHEKNRFQIRLRNVCQWSETGDEAQFPLIPINESVQQATLEKIDKLNIVGFPNYYGFQRFGYLGNNLKQGLLLSTRKNSIGKKRRKSTRLSGNQSLYLSAMRSWLFNQIVASHVNRQFDLPSVTEGSLFGKISRADEDKRANLAPLSEQGQALQLEEAIFDKYPDMTSKLTEFDLKRGARLLRVKADNFSGHFQEGIDSVKRQQVDMILNFELPAGAYATTFLREWVSLKTD